MKVLSALGLMLLGFATGGASVVLHDVGWMVLLAWAATLLTLRALRPGLDRVGYALGWMVAAGLAVAPRAAGGYLIGGAGVRGYAVLALALVVLSFSIATLPVKRRRRLAGHDESAGDAYDLTR